ncbi:MAG: hypothetical protein ACHQAY_16095 [Hyphomicrobiales bacterium]
MTLVPIAQYLAQFTAGGAFNAADQLRLDGPQLQSLDPKAAEELAHQLDDAHARGREEGRGEAAAESALELCKERELLEARLASERESWLAEEGNRMGSAVRAAFEGLEKSVADSVARILKPFLATALREQVLAQLSETLSALQTAEGPLLKVSGPETLLNALREKLGQSPTTIEYAPSSSVDISVVADQTVIESRLQAWIDRFDRATD